MFAHRRSRYAVFLRNIISQPQLVLRNFTNQGYFKFSRAAALRYPSDARAGLPRQSGVGKWQTLFMLFYVAYDGGLQLLNVLRARYQFYVGTIFESSQIFNYRRRHRHRSGNCRLRGAANSVGGYRGASVRARRRDSHA